MGPSVPQSTYSALSLAVSGCGGRGGEGGGGEREEEEKGGGGI